VIEPRDPKAAPPFAFERLTDEEWEELTFLVAHHEDDRVVRLKAPDGGLDTILPSQDRIGRADRGWQAKHYPGEIHWDKCKRSLDRAVEIWEPSHLTFVFPRDLNKDEHQAFHRHLAQRHPEVTVDYWAKAKITAILEADDAGGRIARRFFAVADPIAVMERAMRAGGELSQGSHALDREFAVGEFIQDADPHFHWVIYKGLTSEPHPPRAPGAVIRLLFVKGAQRLVADAVPRSESSLQYGPQGIVITDDSPEGVEAQRLLIDLMEGGGRLELRKGVKLKMERLPKPLGDLVEGPLEGLITVSAVPEAKPWYMRIEVDTDLGAVTFDLDLYPTEPPQEWDSEWTGVRGGLEMTVRTRWLVNAKRGETRLEFRFISARAPLIDLRDALAAMIAVHGSGFVRFVDRTRARDPMKKRLSGSPVHPMLLELKRLVAALVILEEAAGQPMPAIPDQVPGRVVNQLDRAARLLKAGGEIGEITEAHVETSSEGVSEFRRSGSDIEVRQDASVNAFGKPVPVGTRTLKLPLMRVDHAERLPGERDRWRVRLVPVLSGKIETWIEYRPLHPVNGEL